MTESNKHIAAVSRMVEDLFEISAIYYQGKHLVLSLISRFDRAKTTVLLHDRLSSAGYEFSLDQNEEAVQLRIDPRPRLRIPPLNIFLFIATVFTVYVIPVYYFRQGAAGVLMKRVSEISPEIASGLWDQLLIWGVTVVVGIMDTLDALAAGEGIQFAVALMSILLVHEMGHFVASRRRNIVTSWPYFIPAPNLIGSFGAVIRSKSPFWNRRDLIEVGSAGPIAGWIVAIVWLGYGLSQSVILPVVSFAPHEVWFSLRGESIIMKVLTLNILGALPDGYAYKLTEAAFAGWVGMLVTAINLLPIGQLDGGHIVYGLARRHQHMLGVAAMIGLFMLGFLWPGWWLFAALGLIFGVNHPPTINDNKKPGRVATGLGVAALIILVISLTPMPFGV